MTPLDLNGLTESQNGIGPKYELEEVGGHERATG